jgi:hypothetical protein
MGIKKFRRNVKSPGQIVSAVASIAIVHTNSLAIGALNVSGNLTGNDAFRGFTSIASGDATVTISASAISSGLHVNLFAMSSAGQLIPSSIVDDTSFMAEAVDGATATGPLNLTYFIIR